MFKMHILRRIKFYALLCLLFFVSTATTCECGIDVEFRDLTIRNDSPDTIHVFAWPYAVDATFLTVEYVFSNSEYMKIVPPDSTCVVKVDVPWDDKPSRIDNQVMIFKQSTIDKYGREALIENNIYDKLYVFNYEELEQLNFLIAYTGK